MTDTVKIQIHNRVVDVLKSAGIQCDSYEDGLHTRVHVRGASLILNTVGNGMPCLRIYVQTPEVLRDKTHALVNALNKKLPMGAVYTNDTCIVWRYAITAASFSTLRYGLRVVLASALMFKKGVEGAFKALLDGRGVASATYAFRDAVLGCSSEEDPDLTLMDVMADPDRYYMAACHDIAKDSWYSNLEIPLDVPEYEPSMVDAEDDEDDYEYDDDDYDEDDDEEDDEDGGVLT